MMWLTRLFCFHRSLLRKQGWDAKWYWFCPNCKRYLKPVLDREGK